jgi:Zn-dependent M16 (insulinase) family peptidase
MGHNSGDLFELMGDILATARLDDKARFGQMVSETKANMEAGIVGSGHRWE